MDSKPIKVGIISSIIAAVLTAFFINPILSLVWKVVVGTAGTLHRGYVDRIYSNAARDMSGGLISTSLLTLFVLTLIVMYGTVMLLYLSYAGDSEQQRARLYSYSTGAAIGVVVAVFILLSLDSGIFMIESSFNQRLTVLAPAITDIEYKTLKARWVTMHGEADYDALVQTMDKRAAELGVTLPPVRKP